jgi:hypothetical protein
MRGAVQRRAGDFPVRAGHRRGAEPGAPAVTQAAAADFPIRAIIATGHELPVDQDPKDDQRCSIS